MKEFLPEEKIFLIRTEFNSLEDEQKKELSKYKLIDMSIDIKYENFDFKQLMDFILPPEMSRCSYNIERRHNLYYTGLVVSELLEKYFKLI